jgi:phosphate transport system substrate-binding protein
MGKKPSTKFQASNPKQIPISNHQNTRQAIYTNWILEVRNYWGFGIWKLGFACALLFCLLLVPGLLGCQRSKPGITVAGSTSVEPFAELLGEEYMKTHPGSNIYVQGGGSTAGVVAARTHAANIGMSSRSLLPEEKDLLGITVARDAIAVIVHPRNPIRDLPPDKIVGIFSRRIKTWDELGWDSHPIVVVTREEGSGTRETFQKLVMKDEEITLAALVQDSNGAIRQVVSNDSHAIGYISLGLVNEKVKALNISGVEPTVANIEAGTYKLVRPFLFVFDKPPSGREKEFLDFVLSPKGQRLLEKEGLVPATFGAKTKHP